MIVVTGGTGFIGSNLVAALEARGEPDLVVCDRAGVGDKWRNVAKRELADLIFPEDLPEFLDAHADSVKAVFHMGAISSTTETDADLILRTNVHLSRDLWWWCAKHSVPFIYASSAATYGDGAQGFDDDLSVEALRLLRPLNAYGWSKHLFDRRVARWVADGAESPPQWAGLKFFNVFGPNEYHKGSMRSLVAKSYPVAAAGDPVTLFRSHHPDYADGGQMRDFVSVHDCVSVMLWLYDHPQVSGLFNVGTGQARSFQDLITAMFTALGRPPAFAWTDTPVEIRANYQYFTEANMDRLRAAGYADPFTPLEQAVADYVNDYLSAADPYR